MTRPDLAAIRARLEAAPPGPWEVARLGDGWQLLGPTGAYQKTNGNGDTEPVAGGRDVTPYVLALEAGRDFVTHAAGDMRALLDELEKRTGPPRG